MRFFWSLVAVGVLVAAGGAVAGELPDQWQAKVDPWVLEKSNSDTEFIVFLSEQADLSGAATFQTKAEKGRFVFNALRRVAAVTQPAVLARLKALGADCRSYWIANMIWVRGDQDVVRRMAEREDVFHIYANPSVRLREMPHSSFSEKSKAPSTVEWNIALVGAPDVWTFGIDGQGAVVAGQDTGYFWSHPALINQYRGGPSGDHAYNWHDSVHSGGGSTCGADSPEPCDDHGHGTHTMGTIVGDDGVGNQVGMAPGARWIGCRNMDQGVGTPTTYAECYQFFLAPTDLSDENPDPSKAPDVINNSWGCPPDEGCTDPNVLLSVVQSIRAAGIVTVHSAGNDGSSCSTVGDPSAIYDESFSVGATNSSDDIASFSSRGPVTIDGSNRLKPDISAPGVDIRSSTVGGGYGGNSGTSMAGPHVAGLVALVLSAKPELTGDVDAVENVIEQTALSLTTAQGCGGDAGDAVPNNVFGWGRIDALAAINSLVDYKISVAPETLKVCAVQGSHPVDVSLQALSGFSEPVTLEVSGLPVGVSGSFSPADVTPPGSSVLSVSTTLLSPEGIYPTVVSGVSNPSGSTAEANLELSVFRGVPDAPTLIEPVDGAVDVASVPTLSWSAVSGTSEYTIEVATDSSMLSVIYSGSSQTTSHTLTTALDQSSRYFWHVLPVNPCGEGSPSAVFEFTTGAVPLIFSDGFETGDASSWE